MKTKAEATAMLAALKAGRWDMQPPSDGRIRWYNEHEKLTAYGKFKIILSIWEGGKYQMGYNTPLYDTLGLPYVKKLDEGPDVVESGATEEEIWARAESVARLFGADFVFQASTLLIAVFEFEKVSVEA